MTSFTLNDRQQAREFLFRITKKVPKSEPWEWVIRDMVVKTPAFSGNFSPTGREYMRQMINDINDDSVAEQTVCAGTGSGKTMKNLAQALWAFENYPFSGLYVMPTKEGEGGARQFNNGSMIPSIEQTECLARKLPGGADRHKVSGLHLEFGGNNLGFVGANSPTQLGAKRCRIVWLDEQDKYKEQLGREAGADYLAGERTKQVLDKKIIRSSTPTKEMSGIWPHLMRSNLNRRFLPCPHCNPTARGKPIIDKGWFVLVKDKNFSVLPDKTETGEPIPIAQLVWDKEARRKDKSWDEDRVVRSTRFECPHCGGHVRDHHRQWADKNGVWVPTRRAMLHAGYHLSSYYAPYVDFDSSWGGMAKKFLNQFEAGTMAGYINSDLAEVDVKQAIGQNRIELISHPVAQADWVPLLTADYQKNWPHIWFVARKWSAFKLLPKFELINGRPEFAAALESEENSNVKRKVETLLDGYDEASVWNVIAELMRFDSRTGESPIIGFLLGQKIVGQKLVKFFYDAGCTAIKFRESIYREMSRIDGKEIRAHRGGDSELIAAGHCAQSGEYAWDELAEIIQQFEIGKGMSIPNRCVAIDCGYAEKFNREVLRKCYERASVYKYYDPMSRNRPPLFYPRAIHGYCLPAPHDGWLAIKGYPMNQRWNHGGIKNELNINLEDPFFGTPKAGTAVTEVLELPSGYFWLRKQDLREKKTKLSYTVSPEVEWFPKNTHADGGTNGESSFTLDRYQRQLNEQYYDDEKCVVLPRHGKGGAQSRAHPFHLDDCEVYQIGLASYHEFFEEGEQK